MLRLYDWQHKLSENEDRLWLQVCINHLTRCRQAKRLGVSSDPLRDEDAVNVISLLLGNIDRNPRSPPGVASDIQAVDATHYRVISAVVELVKG